jgi:heme exporter protein D
MAWAYLTFIQYLIMWSGNLSKKVVWYVERTEGTWEAYVIFFILINLVAFILLSLPNVKRRREIMIGLAGLLLFIRLLDLIWIVMPHYSENVIFVFWDFAPFLAVGGLWIALFAWMAKQHPLVPVNHPTVVEMLEQEGHGYEPA